MTDNEESGLEEFNSHKTDCRTECGSDSKMANNLTATKIGSYEGPRSSTSHKRISGSLLT